MKRFALILLAIVAAIGIGVLSACKISDGVGVTGVQLSATELTVKVGESKSLTATVLPEDASNKLVKWSSDNQAVATVEEGVVTGVSAGTAQITVTTLNNSRKATCAVTVTAGEDTKVEVTGVEITPSTLSLTVGQTSALSATVLPVNATDKTVTWASENTAAATVDQDGLVTAVAAGTARISAKAGDKTAYCTVTVSEPPAGTIPVTSVSVTPSTRTLNVGEKVSLTAIVLPDNATDKAVTWESRNSQIATVDQSGQVTAVAAGEVDIIATAGGVQGKCTLTVTSPAKSTYDVKFYSDGTLVDSQTVQEGEKAVEPKDVTKENYTLKGWAIGSVNGDIFDFTTPIEDNTDLYAVWESDQTPDENSPITYTYAGNECAAFEWTEADISSSNVKVGYKLSSASSYTYLEGSDRALIRAAAAEGAARVDIVGLKGGENYDFSITTSENKTYFVTGMKIAEYDRSGYAHFKNASGVGAYNGDGTLKSNAVVIYVTEATKNNLTVTIDKKSYSGKSIVEILGGAKDYTSTPVVVRIIGTVGAATWNKLEEGEGEGIKITADQVTGKLSGKNIIQEFGINVSGKDDVNIYQKDLKDKGVNTLNTDDYAELNGLDSKIKYDVDKAEFDSAWNNCIVKNAKDITVEGIGENACIAQWGFTWKNCSSIELRNITFKDYPEDACSFEADETNAADLAAFKSGNYWIHHNTFEVGKNNWDVCNEQDKHDGDGSTDFKGVKNVTLSYNVYNGTHKTGLIGGSNSQTTANVTFHHNFYNGCKARLPLGRQANMHMYNNYYKDTTDTDISLRAEAYAFIENCYFENNNNSEKMVELRSDGPGSAKIIGCVIDVNKIYLENDKPLGTDGSSDRLYLGSDRNAKVKTNENKFGKDFDTSAELFYYANGKSNVTEMLTAEQTKVQIPLVAGVMKRTSGTGGGTVSGGETDPGTGGETDPGTQGGGTGGESSGDTQTVANCVVIFSNGAQLLSNGSLTELPANSGITVTAAKDNAAAGTASNEFQYDNKTYTHGYKLESATLISISLAQTKKVTLYFYDYKQGDRKVKINSVAKDGENQETVSTDKEGKPIVRFSVTVTINAGETCKIEKSSKEAVLCYMIISDAE